MKLNHNCVRDMLLFLEKELYDKPLKIQNIANSFEKIYTEDEIVYTFQKLEEAKFIVTSSDKVCNKHSLVKTITWKGHNFLDNIRDDKIVQLAKNACKNLKSFSIEVFADVCKEIIKNFIKL